MLNNCIVKGGVKIRISKDTLFSVIPLGVFHEPIFWVQSKDKTQTTMQFFGFLFFLTYKMYFERH
jgi:hypothetical protein